MIANLSYSVRAGMMAGWARADTAGESYADSQMQVMFARG